MDAPDTAHKSQEAKNINKYSVRIAGNDWCVFAKLPQDKGSTRNITQYENLEKRC